MTCSRKTLQMAAAEPVPMILDDLEPAKADSTMRMTFFFQNYSSTILERIHLFAHSHTVSVVFNNLGIFTRSSPINPVPL